MTRNEELEAYKKAVWDFLLEHCDIMDGGSLFIKFHTDGRSNFERRVNARLKYGYHREDVQAKEARHLQTKENFKSEKAAKREKYILGRAERRKALEKVKRINARRRFYDRLLRLIGIQKNRP